MRRIAARASASAAAVTVQVLSTTQSASLADIAACRPRCARLRSMEAPSACVARHPKFCTKNFSGITLDYKEPGVLRSYLALLTSLNNRNFIRTVILSERGGTADARVEGSRERLSCPGYIKAFSERLLPGATTIC